MKIRIIANAPITTAGTFHRGDILGDDKYPLSFLNHLVNEAGAAEIIEAKVINPVTENKAVTKKKRKKRSPSSAVGQASKKSKSAT